MHFVKGLANYIKCWHMFLTCETHIESSKCVQNTLEHLDPQFTNYQFKLNVKQLMCGIWT